MFNILVESHLPELPEYQSPETIKRIVSTLNQGDAVHMILQGEKKNFFDSLGIPQIHGAVQEIQPDNRPTIFSTYFLMAGELLIPQEPRTFSPEDIRLIESEPAEEYIPRASDGRFKYDSKAVVQTKSAGEQIVTIQMYFDGTIQSVNADGEFVSGGADFFKPIE